jgi:hypothetical protein
MSDLQSSQSRVSYENMLACGWTQQNSVLGSPQLVCYDTILVFTSIKVKRSCRNRISRSEA